MSTDYLTEAYDALAQRLAGFAYSHAFSVRWEASASEPVYDVIYIEPEPNFEKVYTQDQGPAVNPRYDGKFKLRLKVPERDGYSRLSNLVDALNAHFFPNGEPIAFSMDNALNKQAVHVVREPSLEGELEEVGGYVEGMYAVHFFLTPQRGLS